MHRSLAYLHRELRQRIRSIYTLWISLMAFTAFSSFYTIQKHYFGAVQKHGLTPISSKESQLLTSISNTNACTESKNIHSVFNCTSQMSRVPGGIFTMGGQLEHPIRSIFVSEFWMDSTEITKENWDYVRNWSLSRGYDLPEGRSHGGGDHPVVAISWHDATKWLNARSEMNRIRPAYYTDTEHQKVYKRGIVDPIVNWNTGFRLPTEAEWEKAGRGGADGYEFSWSHDNEISTNRCNYNRSNIGGTLPVASYSPNGFGIFDMCGNVSEWCWDYWGPYSTSPQCLTDPAGRVTGVYRVIRGGSWTRPANRCRIAFRYFFFMKPTTIRTHDLGFRGVINLG
jgi:formylglycine-generating enzyme required for sulfatase activity